MAEKEEMLAGTLLMDITISHPDFKTQLLELRISGYFLAPKILLNGVHVKRFAGAYLVLNDIGHEVSVRLNSSAFNRLPQLLIDEDEITISHAGWTQFAGWKKSLPGLLVLAMLNFAGARMRGLIRGLI